MQSFAKAMFVFMHEASVASSPLLALATAARIRKVGYTDPVRVSEYSIEATKLTWAGRFQPYFDQSQWPEYHGIQLWPDTDLKVQKREDGRQNVLEMTWMHWVQEASENGATNIFRSLMGVNVVDNAMIVGTTLEVVVGKKSKGNDATTSHQGGRGGSTSHQGGRGGSTSHEDGRCGSTSQQSGSTSHQGSSTSQHGYGRGGHVSMFDEFRVGGRRSRRGGSRGRA